MTSFFVAAIESEEARAEEAYSELGQRPRAAAGPPARWRRIFKLGCCFDERDREIEVGRPLSTGGDVVLATRDHGRCEAFWAHTDGGGESATARVNQPVYLLAEFS